MINKTVLITFELLNGAGAVIRGVAADAVLPPMGTIKNFQDLADVPVYKGHKGKGVFINQKEDGVEYIDVRAEVRALDKKSTDADTKFRADLDAAITESKSADSVLRADLNKQINDSNTQDATLQKNIDAEAKARLDKDNNLQTQITNEVNTRTADVTALKTADTNEAKARADADTAITNTVNANKKKADDDMTKVQGQIGTLTANTSAKDVELQQNIDALQANVTAMDTKHTNTNTAQDTKIANIEKNYAPKTWVQEEIKKISITEVFVVADRKALPDPKLHLGDFYFLTATNEWVVSDGTKYVDITGVIPDSITAEFEKVNARITSEISTLLPTIKPAYEWLKLGGYTGTEQELIVSLNNIKGFNPNTCLKTIGGTITGYVLFDQNSFTDNKQLVNKKYVDDKCAAERTNTNAVDAKNVSKAGDTMTGTLTAASIKNAIQVNGQGSVSFQDAANTRFHLVSEGNYFKLKHGNNGETAIMSCGSNGDVTASNFMQSTAQSSAANSSTRKDYVDAQIKVVDDKNFTNVKTALSVHLNTLGATTSAGVYYQPENQGATTANGYPMAEAGTLICTLSAYGCQQEYTTFNTGRKFVRGLSATWNGTDGPWYAWKEMYSTNKKPTAAEVGALPIVGGVVTGNLEVKGNFTINGEDPRGTVGAKGDQGIQGPKGDKGDKGDKGATGDKGDTGAQGAIGPKGDTGAQGIQGPKGDKGDKGLQGDKGDKGDKGDTGAAGTNADPYSITVRDTRAAIKLPNQYTDRTVQASFTNVGTPSAMWHGSLVVNGWTAAYNAWELCADSNNTDFNNKLFFRGGRDGTWKAWNEIYHTGNKPDATDVGAVPSGRKVNNKALTADITLTAADVGAVPPERTVNGKPLSANVVLAAADVSAVPTTRTINTKPLSADITLTAADVNAVPTTRKVNNKELTADITLSAADVGASPTAHTHTGALNTPIGLGTEDLDTLKTPGHYAQHANANTSAERHYPENNAGGLIVTSGAGVQQRYHVYNTNRIYTRAQYDSGPWTAWSLNFNTTNPPTAADVSALPTAGGTMSGNLTINNSAPTITLQDTDHMGAVLHNNSNQFYVLRTPSANNGSYDGGPNGRHPMTLNLSTGDVVFSGNVVAYSDARLKHSVKPLQNALGSVLQLNPVQYKRIGDDTPDRLQCGFIAQELREVIPEVVIEQQDEDKTLAVDYAKLVAYMAGAIQELDRASKELEARIRKLEGGE